MTGRRGRGFTLLEVLVALVVLAFAMGAALTTASRSARNSAALETRMLAHWVSMNEVNEAIITGIAPEQPEQRTFTRVLLGRPYQVTTRLRSSELDDRVELQVQVAALQGDGEILEDVTAVVALAQ